jgi:phosphoglycolate phosphatase
MTKFPACVLFDLDGTLIDSLPDVTAALNFALERDESNALKVSDVRLMVGQGAEPMIKLALKLLNEPLEPNQIKTVLSSFLSRYADFPDVLTQTYPGVYDVLEQLRTADVKMGICTNKPLRTTTPVLTALKLEQYFEVVVCGDQVTNQKPDGRHVIDTLALMNADKATSVLVGDSDNDISAAQNANISSIAVGYGYCHTPVENLGADIVIKNFIDLPNALTTISMIR